MHTMISLDELLLRAARKVAVAEPAGPGLSGPLGDDAHVTRAADHLADTALALPRETGQVAALDHAEGVEEGVGHERVVDVVHRVLATEEEGVDLLGNLAPRADQWTLHPDLSLGVEVLRGKVVRLGDLVSAY